MMGPGSRYRLSLAVIGGGVGLSFVHNLVMAPVVTESPVGTAATFIPPIVAAVAALALIAFVRDSDLANSQLGRGVAWYAGGAILFGAAIYASFAQNFAQQGIPWETWFSVFNWAIGGSALGLVVANYDLRRTLALENARRNERRARRITQRLSVLSRVLRHDIRNKLTVIKGRLAGLSDDPDNPDVAAIEDAADSLLRIADRARRLRRIVEDETPRTVDLTAVLDAALDALREDHPDARITASELPDITVRTYPDIRIVLDEVLANAIDHNPRPESDCRVDVTLKRRTTEAGDRAEVLIRDNGPGIPERETVVTSDAVETALEHSRGTSLWLARWVVDESDGSFSVEPLDAGGALVRIRLPIADSDRADAPARNT